MITRMTKTLGNSNDAVRTAYVIVDDNIIMLNELRMNADIAPHKHPHKQFEYCFSGQYNLDINNKQVFIRERSGYLINGPLPHSYHAVTGVYAFCLKYLGSNDQADVQAVLFQQVHNDDAHSIEQITLETANLFNICTYRRNASMTLHVKPSDFCLCVVSSPTVITMNEAQVALTPMEIYGVTNDNGCLAWCIENQSEMVIIQIRRHH